jgi:hypothetical protein
MKLPASCRDQANTVSMWKVVAAAMVAFAGMPEVCIGYSNALQRPGDSALLLACMLGVLLLFHSNALQVSNTEHSAHCSDVACKGLHCKSDGHSAGTLLCRVVCVILLQIMSSNGGSCQHTNRL